MKRIIIFCLSLALLLACVPTPEESVVISKDSYRVKEKEDHIDLMDRLTVPEHITEELTFAVSGVPKALYQNGALSTEELKKYDVPTTVIVDADVIAPGVSDNPRLVVAPEPLSNETIVSFLSACRPVEGWKTGCSGNGITQENIKQQMRYYTNLTDESNPLWDAITVNGVVYDADDVSYAKDALLKQVQTLQAGLADAPVHLDGEFAAGRGFSGDMQLFAETEGVMPDRIIMRLYGSVADEISFFSGKVLGTPSFQMNNAAARLYQRAKAQPAISLLEGQNYADAFVSEITGVDFRLAERGTDTFINMQLPFTEWMFEGVYTYLYIPVIESTPLNYADVSYMENELNWSNTHPETQFNEVKPQSALFVYVDETGVVGAVWKGACQYRITETLQASPEMLSVDEIMEQFNRHIAYGTYFSVCNRLYPETLPESETLVIDRIELGYALVISRQVAAAYELVPVWDFYGHMDEQYSGKTGYKTNGDHVRTETQAGRVYLTVNATDGSIVNRIIGY